MIRYRSAVVSDAAAIAALMATGFTDTFGHLYRPEDLAAFIDRLSPAAYAAELSDGRHLVRLAEDDGVPAGFAKLGPSALPVTPAGPAIELRQLYVLAPWQGAGVAAALMDWAIATARDRGAAEMFLSVYVDNHRARRFYARYGFERIGRYDFMVGAHRDEDDIMRLAL